MTYTTFSTFPCYDSHTTFPALRIIFEKYNQTIACIETVRIVLDDKQIKTTWLTSHHRDSAFPVFISSSRRLNWETNAWNFSESRILFSPFKTAFSWSRSGGSFSNAWTGRNVRFRRFTALNTGLKDYSENSWKKIRLYSLKQFANTWQEGIFAL